MKKTAIVTGASSFVGSAVVEALIKENYHVISCVRGDSTNMGRLSGLDTEIVTMDISAPETLLEKTDSADIFLHFAWAGGRQDKATQEKNVGYSLKALETAKKLGCRTFIFAGSQAEYGQINGAITEEAECNPVSEYGKNKLLFGRLGHEKAAQLGIDFIHLRIFSIYGYNDLAGRLVESCIDTFRYGGEIALGKCTHTWNYLYIKDFQNVIKRLVCADISLLKDGGECIINVGSKRCSPLKQYVEEIYEVSEKKGGYKLGARAENAEGSPSIQPDISRLVSIVGDFEKYSFKKGVSEIMEKKFGKKCIVCENHLGNSPLMEFNDMPASAQDIPDKKGTETDKAINLRLFQCEECGLVQFDCEPVSYYKDVIRSGGFSTTMVELRRAQYKKLVDTYNLSGKKILEAGCGQGEFLSVLKEFPVEPVGIENKADLVKKARDRGLFVIEGFITDNAEEVKENGPYGGFLSFNFLEHQPAPKAMLRAIRDNLEDGGVGLITVPSLEYILEHDGYYEFIRDHIAYYTFDTLRTLVNMCGFDVLEEETINRDTISVVVRKRKKHDISKIQKSAERISGQFERLISELNAKGKRLAVWGASHQGFTIASTLKLSGKVEYIIDSAPFKQNLYAPASHIPIVSPEYFKENKTEAVLILAPGYTKEISGIIKEADPTIEVFTLMAENIEKI